MTAAPRDDTRHLAPLAAVPPLLGLARVRSGALLGLEFQAIDIEVASRRGPAAFQLAGLAEATVREARVRVSSALGRLGVSLDEYSLTVSLAPADLRKSGAAFDLALAVCVLGAIGFVTLPSPASTIYWGELSLDGRVRPVRGILPLLAGARRLGLSEAFVPRGNAAEAAHLRELTVRTVDDLGALVDHLRGRAQLPPLDPGARAISGGATAPDLSEVRGQSGAKRAAEVAAAGRHNLLFVGPPGSGKSLLARRVPGLLPPLEHEQALETTAVHSVAGLIDASRGIVEGPPFRAPHHTTSEVGLVGGGSPPRPGEISLAHHGVLFLDELPEFRRGALEALREPLEEGEVRLVRGRARVIFPARPLVVAAMNPCPCGHYGSPRVPCRCTPEARARYLARLSGPLLERIDLQITVPPVELDRLSPVPRSLEEGSSKARARVEAARALQAERQRRGEVAAPDNGVLSLDELEHVARPDEPGRALLRQATERLGLSARGYVRVLRVARTLADLSGRDAVRADDVGEALRYRRFDPAAAPRE